MHTIASTIWGPCLHVPVFDQQSVEKIQRRATKLVKELPYVDKCVHSILIYHPSDVDILEVV